jgi:hypothetical protein
MLTVNIVFMYYCEVCEDIPNNMCKDHCVHSCYQHEHSRWHWTCCGPLMHVVGERKLCTSLHLCWHDLCLIERQACQKPIHRWLQYLFQLMRHGTRVLLEPWPSRRHMRHPSRYGRCPLEHPLCDIHMSMLLDGHLSKYRGWRGHHVTKLHTRFQRCPLIHPQIFNNMCTSPWRTTFVVVQDVTFDDRSVVLDCDGFMLDVKMNVCDIVADIVHVIRYIEHTLCRQWLRQTRSCHRRRHMPHPGQTACLF